MTSIQITASAGSVTLTSPYDPACRNRAHDLGGKYTDGTWVFSARDEDRVRALAREIYGTDGSPEPTVTVRINTAELNFRDHYEEIRLAGRSLARRKARDSRVVLGDGVVVVEGQFPARGGSVKNPCLDYTGEGIVLEVRDVPAGAAALMAKQAGEAVTIVDADAPDREALTAERARLLARVAEIDALLS